MTTQPLPHTLHLPAIRSALLRLTLATAQIVSAVSAAAGGITLGVVAAPPQVAQAAPPQAALAAPPQIAPAAPDATTGPGGVMTGLSLWYKADAGITQTVNNGVVPSWADQGDNGIMAAQSTASYQPVYTPTGINFNPAVTFDGSNDNLQLSSIASLPGGYVSRTVFAVANVTEMYNRVLFSYGVAWTDQTFYMGQASMAQPLLGAYGDDLRPGDGVSDWNKTPRILAGTHTGITATLYSNGLALAPTYNSSAWNTVLSGGAGSLGSVLGNFYYWMGNIGEVILCQGALTPVEMQRVNSYLAVKYGLTITATDYLASNGSVIWDKTANAGYLNDIAGIGRDDASALNQKQSASVNEGNVLTIGLGTITTTNAANPNSFADDKRFMLWGHNALTTTFTTPYSPTSYAPATGAVYRIGRVWKMQETGTVTTVQVRAPASLKVDHLLVSSDPAFATNVTEVALTSDGQGNMAGSVDFADGQYFTFAGPRAAPGGVEGLNVWYKADAGITQTVNGGPVPAWADQSDYGIMAAQTTAANRPAYLTATAGINFNPALSFDGLNDYLQLSSIASLPGGHVSLTVFAVANVTTTHGGGAILWYGNSPHDFDFGAGQWNGTGLQVFLNDIRSPAVGVADPTATPFVVAGAHNGSQATVYANGMAVANGNSSAWNTNLGGMGTIADAASPWPGKIGEVILYTGALTPTQMAQVNSYLAVKYGLTLTTTDYLASDGRVIWNKTANAGYLNDIAGIGRDDASGLVQKQSASANAGNVLTIGLGTIAASNAANPNAFAADKTFMVWGHNGGSASLTSVYSPTTYAPVGPVEYRLPRVWKVQETAGAAGTVQTVAVHTPVRRNRLLDHLLVSTDPTFTSGVTEVPLTDDGQGNYTVSFDFADGQYFTFAGVPLAPGGVTQGLNQWYRADRGITQTVDGGGVPSWDDLSDNLLVAAQSETAWQPAYQAAAFNSNPALLFNGLNSELRLSSIANLPGGNISRTIFAVANSTGAGNRGIFSYGTQAGIPGFMLGQYNAWAPRLSGGDNELFLPAGVSDWSATPRIVAGTHVRGTTVSTATLYANGLALERTYNSHGWNTVLSGGTGRLGVQRVYGVDYWSGKIGEVILYSGTLTATQMAQVNSYLAVKYGLTITATDYLASDGNAIWSQTANAGYLNDIAGIGRDDGSGLNQKQSASVNAGNVLTIGLGAIAATNAANANAFADNRNFLVLGHNGASLDVSTMVAGLTGARMARTWKVQETGNVPTVTVRIPQSAIAVSGGQQPFLLRSADATFDSADSVIPLTANGGFYEATVDFADGDSFSFGSLVALQLTNEGPTPATPLVWQPVTYTLRVTNIGASAATNVTLSDLFSGMSFGGADGPCTGGFPCNLDTLNAGDSVMVTAVFTVAADATTIINTASVSSTEVALVGPVTRITAVRSGVALTITKSDPMPNPPVAGQNVTYMVWVTNTGIYPATHVTLDDTASGLTLMSTDASCSLNFPCDLGSLSADASMTITLVYQAPVTATGTTVNHMASVSSTETGLVGPVEPPSGPVTVTSGVVLTLTKSSPEPATPMGGQSVTYTLRVTNTGVNTATNVTLSDMPSGMSFVSLAGACTGNFPCTIASLSAGASVTVTAVFTVNASATAITNTASVTSTEVTVPVTATAGPAAVTPIGPGGVTQGVNLWYKADAGVAQTDDGGPISSWVDQSPYAVTASQGSVGNQPTYEAAGINYNPALSFNGSYMSLSSVSNLPGGNSARTVLAVANTDSPVGERYFFGYGGGASSYSAFNMGQTNGHLGLNLWNVALETPAGVSDWTTAPRTVGVAHTGITATLYSNGVAVGSGDSSAWNTGLSAGYLGYGNWGSSYWSGKVSELVVYQGALTATQMAQVNSYLAVKYGLTITATDYLASDGNAIWSQTANAGYLNDIAGIGRDDASGLMQKQSASVNAGNVLTIGLGTVATTNAANPNRFASDKSFMLWGHDGASLSLSTPVAGLTGARMGRAWKVQETGSVQTVTMRIPRDALPLAAGQKPYLLRSADATFDSADEFIPLTTNGSEYEATVDLASGEYVSFGAVTTLVVTKDGPEPAAPVAGQSVTYTIRVTNTDITSAATHVLLRDTWSAGLTWVRTDGDCTTMFPCDLGSLNVGDGVTVTAVFMVASNATGTHISNTASVSSTEVSTPVSVTTPLATVVSGATLTLTLSDPAPAQPVAGQLVTYTLIVTNTGTSPATDVTVSDAASGLTFVDADPCGSSWPCDLGPLDAGASMTITLVYQAPVTATGTTVNHTASVSSTETGLVGPVAPPSGPVTVTSGAALALSTSDPMPNPPVAGQQVTYTLHVTNTGTSPATDVTLNGMPSGMSFVSADVPCAAGFPCDLGTLNAGATQTIEVVFLVSPNATMISNTASVSSTETGLIGPVMPPSGADTPVTSGAELALSKSDPAPAAPAAGQHVTYMLMVTNTGTSAATDVTLSEQPSGMSFVSADVPCAAGFPCDLGTLSAGASQTIEVVFAVDASATAISNTASVSSTEIAIPVRVTTPDALVTIGVALVLTKTGPEPALPVAGQTVTYMLWVTNTGPNAATNVILNDLPSAGLTPMTASAPCASGFPCDLGTLNSGDDAVVTAVFGVAASAAGAVISNTASVSSTEAPVPVSVTTPDTAVVSGAVLTVAMSLPQPNPAQAGRPVTYTMWVTNLGTSPAIDVVLNDGPSSELSFVSADAPCTGGFPCALGALDAAPTGPAGAYGLAALAAGSSVSLNVVYQIVLTATAISNTASVSGTGLSDPAIVTNPPLNIPVLPRDPDVFGKTAPISGALAIVDEVGLSWLTAGVAETYEVCVGTAPGLCDVTNASVPSPTTSYTASLTTLGDYWWQVTAHGATGVGTPEGTPADGGTAWRIRRGTVDEAVAGTRKTPSTQDMLFGRLLTYTIEVSNVALTPVRVTVTDTLQGQAGFESATPGYVMTGSTLVWSDVEVPAGGTTALEIVVTPSAPPRFQVSYVVTNTAVVVPVGGHEIEAVAAPVTVHMYQVFCMMVFNQAVSAP